MKKFSQIAAQIQWKFGPKYKKSYSQFGEDIIIGKTLKMFGIEKPFYVDIGANDPVILSNTYLFYTQGGRGVCIEPNPVQAKKIRTKRPHDICVEAGIGKQGAAETYYMFKNHELNTFSKEEAEETQKKGHPLLEKRTLSMVDINNVLKDNAVAKIDLLSLDVEGMDLEILNAFDFSKIKPLLICVETKQFSNDFMLGSPIVDFLKQKDYLIIAHTIVNTLFVDSYAWKNRKQ